MISLFQPIEPGIRPAPRKLIDFAKTLGTRSFVSYAESDLSQWIWDFSVNFKKIMISLKLCVNLYLESYQGKRIRDNSCETIQHHSHANVVFRDHLLTLPIFPQIHFLAYCGLPAAPRGYAVPAATGVTLFLWLYTIL